MQNELVNDIMNVIKTERAREALLVHEGESIRKSDLNLFKIKTLCIFMSFTRIAVRHLQAEYCKQ